MAKSTYRKFIVPGMRYYVALFLRPPIFAQPISRRRVSESNYGNN